MDLNERLSIAKLYDSYSALLSDKQRNIFELYINDNLSFNETADILGISRQAVKYALDNVVDRLNSFEDKLHFVEKQQKLADKLEQIKSNPTPQKIAKILEDM